MLRRQPSATTTLANAPAGPSQALPATSVASPRPPVGLEPLNGPPSVASIATSSVHRSSRRNPRLRAPLQRLSSYSQGGEPYSSDEDSESAAEADREAVQAELERSWEQHQTTGPTGTIRERRRQSDSRRGSHARGSRYEDDMYDNTRRQQASQQGYHPRESDVDEEHDEESHPRLGRYHHEHEDEEEESSESIPDSEASYTLKDRQDAINIAHPFGLKIWKPALYKKSRSVQRTAEGEIHSRPGQWPDRKIRIGNILWTLVFGWWMCIITMIMGFILLILTWCSGGTPYAFVLFGLARYLFYPFGRFVELMPDEAYAEEDEGEGRSISEYERYGAVDLERGRQLGIFSSSPVADNRRGLVGRRRGQSIESWGDYSERDSLLGAGQERTEGEDSGPGRKRRFFGRGQWSAGRILFFITYYLVIGTT